MKTVMVVDGAENCAYDCFNLSDGDFRVIFSKENQDIEFIEDAIDNVGDNKLNNILNKMWSSPVDRRNLQGIDGILFFDLKLKKKFYPNKKDTDLDYKYRAFSLESLRRDKKP